MLILAVCGSLQQRSSNGAALRAAARLVPPATSLVEFTDLAAIPHFNPDHDIDPAPIAVQRWRAALTAADGVLVATPEYAHSFPGALKNAFDWIVGSGELYEKPVALMSAGTGGGPFARDMLAETLRTQGCRVVESLGIAGVRPKLDADGELADPGTLDEIAAMLERFVGEIRAGGV